MKREMPEVLHIERIAKHEYVATEKSYDNTVPYTRVADWVSVKDRLPEFDHHGGDFHASPDYPIYFTDKSKGWGHLCQYEDQVYWSTSKGVCDVGDVWIWLDNLPPLPEDGEWS